VANKKGETYLQPVLALEIFVESDWTQTGESNVYHLECKTKWKNKYITIDLRLLMSVQFQEHGLQETTRWLKCTAEFL